MPDSAAIVPMPELGEGGACAAEPAHDPRFAALYGALRRMARARLRGHEAFTLLDTSALAHESFLRLARAGGVRGSDEAAFLAYASRAMRSVIVDAARARLAERRGGGARALPLDEEAAEPMPDPSAVAVGKVHEALQALEASEPRLCEVVSMRYFAGMTEAEAAARLGVSERTVRRESERARLLLRALLS